MEVALLTADETDACLSNKLPAAKDAEAHNSAVPSMNCMLADYQIKGRRRKTPAWDIEKANPGCSGQTACYKASQHFEASSPILQHPFWNVAADFCWSSPMSMVGGVVAYQWATNAKPSRRGLDRKTLLLWREMPLDIPPPRKTERMQHAGNAMLTGATVGILEGCNNAIAETRFEKHHRRDSRTNEH